MDLDGVRHRVYIAFEPEQIKRTDNWSPSDDPDIRYSMREDEYQTQGIHWPMEYGLLGKREVRAAWEAVANAEKRGYYYPETDNGEKFVSSGRYLMVIDTDYRNPTIQTIFEFDDAVADPMDYAKELIINAAGDEDRLRDAYRAIENLFGEGHVVQHDRRSYKSASREIGSRKGSAGGRNSGNAQTGKRARRSYALKEDTEVNGYSGFRILQMQKPHCSKQWGLR